MVAKPEFTHACSPGWTTYTTGPEAQPFGAGTWANPPHASDYPKGTVWACECGRTWVSLGGTPGDRTARFRKERRGERHRRERKAENGD